ncbi:TauD/TfdA family dioxygenase [Rhodococcus triatomae]|uniref:Taurine dioxygenase n=1 Tax=Rhodococcus triatomae TaxID=300028 RepID=A0A1G8NS46_9NOCA|nr:TauD/TfdA family dioxygenase [Rhodococcus triatomae]QNG20070.1 TauD/TfdA family dioxygenase [Rhodococcus triatomae]QNG24014.1 TauD/TfdA family dioxygenase [Rhodococcus triatomae]SDI82786.1 taurine dioxygenase [Rhodococcus triatomae]
MTAATTVAPGDTATGATLDTAEALDVRPVAGHIGAEIHGVDLSRELTDYEVTAIREALHRHKVVFFRGQDIGHAEQVTFSRRFGEVTPSHPYDDEAPEGFPQILAVDSRKYERRFGRKKYSYDNKWHTDVTALINPPAGTILRAHLVPEQGGDTQWTNLVAAYEALPEPLRRLADGLRAEHRFGGRHPQWAEDSSYARKTRENPLVTEHPVVRVHPVTGERALFVTPGFTSRIVGVSPAQSDRLLDLFFAQITDPAFTVRFRWAPGSVAFWDNRATAHLAPTDLDHLDVTRVLYRTTLEGDVPVGPDGRESISLAGAFFRGEK